MHALHVWMDVGTLDTGTFVVGVNDPGPVRVLPGSSKSCLIRRNSECDSGSPDQTRMIGE